VHRRMVNLEIHLRGVAGEIKRERTAWVEVRASSLPGNKSVLRRKRSPGLNSLKVTDAKKVEGFHGNYRTDQITFVDEPDPMRVEKA
jgi:hypothetical protein